MLFAGHRAWKERPVQGRPPRTGLHRRGAGLHAATYVSSFPGPNLGLLRQGEILVRNGMEGCLTLCKDKSPERLVQHEQDHQDSCGYDGGHGSDGWHGGCRAASRVASSALPAAASASCRSPRPSRRWQRRMGRAWRGGGWRCCRRTDRRGGEVISG